MLLLLRKPDSITTQRRNLISAINTFLRTALIAQEVESLFLSAICSNALKLQLQAHILMQ